MTEEELVLAVAQEMGDEVAEETEKLLHEEAPRNFSLNLSEAAAVGAFILQAVQLALQIFQVTKDRAELIKKLEEQAPTPAKVDDVKRHSILARIASKLTGSGRQP